MTNLEGEINYRLLKAQVSQQCLKTIDKSVKSYIKSIKDWSKHKEKYRGMPKLPNYKKDYNLLVFTNQCSSIKNGNIKFTKDLSIRIPQYDKYKDCFFGFQQVRVLPQNDNTLVIEIVYEKECINEELDNTKFASIDLGVDNIATAIFDEDETLIYNGKPIKSVNQFANKLIAKCKSELEKINKKKIRIDYQKWLVNKNFRTAYKTRWRQFVKIFKNLLMLMKDTTNIWRWLITDKFRIFPDITLMAKIKPIWSISPIFYIVIPFWI